MQLCGLYFGTGAATLAIERPSMTKEHSVCRTRSTCHTPNQDTRSIIPLGPTLGGQVTVVREPLLKIQGLVSRRDDTLNVVAHHIEGVCVEARGLPAKNWG